MSRPSLVTLDSSMVRIAARRLDRGGSTVRPMLIWLDLQEEKEEEEGEEEEEKEEKAESEEEWMWWVQAQLAHS